MELLGTQAAWVQRQLTNHARLLTQVVGVGVVSVWTVLRHISNGINFDVVGQISLANQWMHGLHSGALLGVTNYLLKFPLYIVVNSLDFLSPMNRLLLLALICNIATFLLLLVLFEKIARLHAISRLGWLYLAMVWLATIAGNVFWMDYANSRNLETVGGILFLYLVMKFVKVSRRSTGLLIVATASIVFFADSLQLYVCGVGVVVYMLMGLLRHRTLKQAKLAGKVIGLTALGYLGAKLCTLLAERLLHIHFLQTPHQPLTLTSNAAIKTIHGVVSSSLQIFGADFLKRPYTLNSVRAAIGFVVLVGLVVLLVHFIPKLRAQAAGKLVVVLIVVNYLVYMASGQVLVWATSRYLVMVPLFVVLLVTLASNELYRSRLRNLQLSWLLLMVLSSVMLVGALAIRWPERHSKDVPIAAAVMFLHDHQYHYALSSREVGVTATYLAQGDSTVLPLLCTGNHRLVSTDLFYDKAPFERLKSYAAAVPVIVPAGGITSGSATCSRADIVAQLGTPQQEIAVPAVGTAIFFSRSQVAAQHFDVVSE